MNLRYIEPKCALCWSNFVLFFYSYFQKGHLRVPWHGHSSSELHDERQPGLLDTFTMTKNAKEFEAQFVSFHDNL